MPIDVERARAETPGTTSVAHLNNAGAALPSRAVLERHVEHLVREATTGGYEAAEAAAVELGAVYDSVADLVGATPEEIALVDSATRAWHLAFHSLRFGPGRRIVTARAEYATGAISFLQVAARTGATIDVVPDDEHGQVDVAALAERLDGDVVLVALTHVPTQSGLVNPAAEVGALTRAAGVPYLLDACQSVGQLPIDVEAIGCDFLAATGRKWLRAPRGTGFLYVRRSMIESLEPPYLDLHSAEWTELDRYTIRGDARRFELFEHNVAASLAMGRAVDEALGWGLDDIAERVGGLAARLRAKLAEVPGVSVHDRGARLCGIVTFAVNGHAPADVKRRLRSDAINVSVTTVGSARYDLEARGIETLVRASPHYYNTDDELDCLVAAVTRLSAG